MVTTAAQAHKLRHPTNRTNLIAVLPPLEPFPFRLNRNGALVSCFDAFSSREPVSTSLENALAIQAWCTGATDQVGTRSYAQCPQPCLLTYNTLNLALLALIRPSQANRRRKCSFALSRQAKLHGSSRRVEMDRPQWVGPNRRASGQARRESPTSPREPAARLREQPVSRAPRAAKPQCQQLLQ
jgi:hypothetical protein